jgi:YhcH/YjgK/YiaL family protein
MILDRLDTAAAYDSLGERFAAGFKYLRETNFAAVADGKYSIVGDDVFAIVQTYTTKPHADGKWEAHRTYADIQYVFSGVERMGVTPLGSVPSQAPYDADRDVEFFARAGAQEGAAGQFFTVAGREFALFLPHDIHMPSLAVDSPQQVKKVVIKVRV